MWFALVGIIVGIIAGSFTTFTIPVLYARYSAVAIIGILDSVIGAIRADLRGKYSAAIFGSGLISNMVLAAGITYLGDVLQIDLYLAVIVAFTIRILNNIGIIRYAFLTRFLGKRAVREKIAGE
jgi:small basic protein